MMFVFIVFFANELLYEIFSANKILHYQLMVLGEFLINVGIVTDPLSVQSQIVFRSDVFA